MSGMSGECRRSRAPASEPLDLDGLEKLLGEGTKGPWAFRLIRGDDGLGYIEVDGHDIMHAGVSDLPREENEANAALIVAAVNSLPALLSIARGVGELEGARARPPFNIRLHSDGNWLFVSAELDDGREIELIRDFLGGGGSVSHTITTRGIAARLSGDNYAVSPEKPK